MIWLVLVVGTQLIRVQMPDMPSCKAFAPFWAGKLGASSYACMKEVEA